MLHGRQDYLEEPEKYQPISDTAGKSFQTDAYGNFRIIVDGKESKWVSYSDVATLEIDGNLYFGVSKYFQGIFPTECVIRIEKYEEYTARKERNEGFVGVKIIDRVNGQPLNTADIGQILGATLFKDEFDFLVKNIE